MYMFMYYVYVYVYVYGMMMARDKHVRNVQRSPNHQPAKMGQGKVSGEDPFDGFCPGLICTSDDVSSIFSRSPARLSLCCFGLRKRVKEWFVALEI